MTYPDFLSLLSKHSLSPSLVVEVDLPDGPDADRIEAGLAEFKPQLCDRLARELLWRHLEGQRWAGRGPEPIDLTAPRDGRDDADDQAEQVAMRAESPTPPRGRKPELSDTVSHIPTLEAPDTIVVRVPHGDPIPDGPRPTEYIECLGAKAIASADLPAPRSGVQSR